MQRSIQRLTFAIALMGATNIVLGGPVYSVNIVGFQKETKSTKLSAPTYGGGTTTIPGLGFPLGLEIPPSQPVSAPPGLGATLVDSFFDVFFEIEQSGIPSSPLATMTVSMHTLLADGVNTEVDLEVLSLNVNISGTLLRESPTRASLGHTSIQPHSGGYLIDSFFDVFTEISLDNGQTWLPADDSIHYVSVPEPGSLCLLLIGFGIAGRMAFRRRLHKTRACAPHYVANHDQ
jgi:hypothetical protein